MAAKTKKKTPKRNANDRVEIKRSKIHRWGGFARKPIASGDKVIQYIGEIIDKKESARRCEDQNYYIFELNGRQDIDGNVDWNPARFLNHSCNPNCEALNEDDTIWIVALRDIGKGEELTFNYGYDIDDYQDHPCGCGADNCVGYIVATEFFADVKRKEKRRARQAVNH